MFCIYLFQNFPHMSDLEWEYKFNDITPLYYRRIIALYEEEPVEETLDTARALFAMFRNMFPVPPRFHFRPIERNIQ